MHWGLVTRSFPTNVREGLCDVQLVPALAGQSWTPLQARAFILTAVKRKIYLEVLVEDHYLLPVRLINLFLFY